MKLDRVTLTGADDSVSPESIIAMSREYDFVEWGILVSEKHFGTPRFPSVDWIVKLALAATVNQTPLKLSLHLCGRWVRELLLGNIFIPNTLLLPIFQRIQLNFHAENTACEPHRLHRARQVIGPRQYIFQIDGSGGNQHLESVYQVNNEVGRPRVDAVPLFDVSGGAGIVPAKWPEAKYMADGDRRMRYHGYAGGLGPDTLREQLPRIIDASGTARIWIDMETRIRSNADRLFDLAKCRECLDIVQPF